MCTNTNGLESGIPHSIDETILGCFKDDNSPYQHDSRGSETASRIGAGTWSISLSEKSSSWVVPARNCICFIVSCVSFLMFLLLLLLLLLLPLVVVRRSSNTRLRRRCCCCCWIRQQWTKVPEIPLLHAVFPKIGVPQNGWFIMENPIEMGWFGGTTIFWKKTCFVGLYSS